MGLAGPRNRRKIDHDPNNTKWTRDETTFGQKILRAQGWEPGQCLGAQEASHAQFHSAASFAPIKINLKDDTLGLGAKIRQKQSDECTGLDVFKDLLGRLNGKSEETLDKERQIRSVIKTNLYVERKYGPMRFVSGGVLVGDHIKMAELIDKKREATPIKEELISEASEAEVEKKEKKEKKQKKSKKRKASEAEAEEVDAADSKREKKRKKRAQLEEGEPESNNAEVVKPTKKEKSKKEKKSKRSEKESESGEPEGKVKKSKKSKKTSGQESPSNDSTEASEDAASEKATKKEKKKHKKRKQTDGIEADIPTTSTASSTAPQDSGSSTPSNTSTPTPHALSARHRARSRHIASKKLAFGDMQALNQIFMIKPV